MGYWSIWVTPQPHEDDARRAVHTGLGIVQAITTLNTHLVGYGTVCHSLCGCASTPARSSWAGQMGGGGRHEHLALGETPNIAAPLRGLGSGQCGGD